MTVSLDGFFAGPHLKVSPLSAALLKEAMARVGAEVWGRRTFEITRAWGGHPPGGVPCFIVTHAPLPEWVYEGSPFTFVTAGVRLFADLDHVPVELETIRVVNAPGVTHLGFRVVM